MTLKYEPALVTAAVVALLNLAFSLMDLDLGSEIPKHIAEAATIIIGGWIIRQKVVPVKKLEAENVQ